MNQQKKKLQVFNFPKNIYDGIKDLIISSNMTKTKPFKYSQINTVAWH